MKRNKVSVPDPMQISGLNTKFTVIKIITLWLKKKKSLPNYMPILCNAFSWSLFFFLYIYSILSTFKLSRQCWFINLLKSNYNNLLKLNVSLLINTLGKKKRRKESIKNDIWQMFHNLQFHSRFTLHQSERYMYLSETAVW